MNEVTLGPMSFRLTPVERDYVNQAAKLLGKSASAYVRELVIEETAKVIEANRSALIAQKRAEIARLQDELEQAMHDEYEQISKKQQLDD